MKNNAVFICGSLRSGSSLTHLMLDQHPEINNPGEFDFLFDLVGDDGHFPSVHEYNKWLATHRIFLSKNLELDSSLSYPELIDSFISQLTHIGSTLALNIHRKFDCIPYLYPQAKYIHLIRDPRDVARSSIGMGWSGNVFHGVEHWLETESSWRRLRNKISADQYLEIKFEELINEPEQTLKAVCTFLELPYSQIMLDYESGSTYSKPDPSLVCQWKTKLTVREVQHVESRAHDLMLELGYELSGYQPITVGRMEQLWLKLMNKRFKLNFSIRRHGFLLFVTERFSRLFKIKSMHDKARMAMNENDKQHLK